MADFWLKKALLGLKNGLNQGIMVTISLTA
jgi:hypothetical protein